MQIHELTPSVGRTRKSKKILWRGNSSGHGNYCGKGLKGQRARAWWTVPLWFEWGQTPLHMRLPKARGFKRYFKLVKDVAPINLATLENLELASPITHQSLADAGLIKSADQDVKILWNTVSKSLSFEWISLFSKSAREAVESAGGSIA